VRIDDLINLIDRSHSLREEASAYKGNWRDVVLFVCVVLFAVIWWYVPHSRTNWLPTFIVLNPADGSDRRLRRARLNQEP
jgi:hypothetical protein